MVVNTGTRLFDMLNKEVMTDITFVVQGMEIKGHRVVASSQGGVLQELLENCKGNRVEISQDIAPHTFKTVLQYLYTGTCEVSNLNLFEVTHAAKNLGLDGLEGHCSETVTGKLSATNVGAFTSQALQFDAKENTKVCQEYFRKNTQDVIKAKEFLEIPVEVLLTLCSSEGITCSELELFLACVKWAEKESQRQKREGTPENLRAVLGDVLNHIRFPCMPKTDFEDVVVPLEILTYEEVGQLITGWKKKENRTQYSNKLRTETVKVTVKDYREKWWSGYVESELPSVPLSTRISELKTMKIFRGCTEEYPADQFTLSHKGEGLADNVTLASIHTPGEDLVLEIHSVSYTVRKGGEGGWDLPITITAEDIWEKVENIVKGHIFGYKGIHPDNVKDLTVADHDFPRAAYSVNPGTVIYVTLK